MKPPIPLPLPGAWTRRKPGDVTIHLSPAELAALATLLGKWWSAAFEKRAPDQEELRTREALRAVRDRLFVVGPDAWMAHANEPRKTAGRKR